MKKKCAIVLDLLPLYAEGLLSEESRAFVKEHTQDCPECQKALEETEAPAELPGDLSAAPLKRVKKRLSLQRLQSAAAAAAVAMILLLSLFAYLTAPQYLPYSPELITVSAQADGRLSIQFSNAITGSEMIIQEQIVRDGVQSIHVSAWFTVWDRLTAKEALGGIYRISPEPGLNTPVYYTPNNGDAELLIYGVPPDGSTTISLPRLTLNYYLYLCILAAALLAIAGAVMRRYGKSTARLTKITLVPLSYILAHILIKGFPVSTYSLQRDLAFICALALLIYLAALLIMGGREKSERERL